MTERVAKVGSEQFGALKLSSGLLVFVPKTAAGKISEGMEAKLSMQFMGDLSVGTIEVGGQTHDCWHFA